MVLWQPGQRLTYSRLQTATPTDLATYTPTVTNGGSATFSVQTGLYSITDVWVDVLIYLALSATGTGSGIVAVDMPTTVDRSTRQILGVHSESNGAAGNASSHIAGGECVFLTSGSGARSDRIRIDEGGAVGREGNVTGVDLLNNGQITIQGRYRRA